MSDHISSGFDESLDEINKIVLSMGGLALSQFHAVLSSIDAAEPAVLEDLIAADQKIDDLEVDLNNKAIQTIALWSPFAEDLRKVFVAIKMGQMLERTGDYAANIAKRRLTLDGSDVQNKFMGEFSELGDMARNTLADALDAYRHADTEKAIKIWENDIQLDELHNALNRSIVIALEKNEISAIGGSQFLFMAKNIERVGDFATGIAEQVYFLVNAKQIDADRPKA